MNQVEYRAGAEATLRPEAREGLVVGGHLQLVTLQLTDDGYVTDDTGEPVGRRPPVRCELRPQEARLLAYTLLALAERAELRRSQPAAAERATIRARARAAARAARPDATPGR
jgi:hypothetical protein